MIGMRGADPAWRERETERLRLCPARLDDIPALHTFLGDAEAMRFSTASPTYRACRRRVLVHEWFRRRDRCAPWTVLRKSDGAVIGWGGLYRDPFDRGWGIELGYALHRAVWGQRLASELAAEALLVADRELALPEVLAFAHPDNTASCRLLERAGFAIVRPVPEMQRLLYRRLRPG